jgi:hypothetical protein
VWRECSGSGSVESKEEGGHEGVGVVRKVEASCSSNVCVLPHWCGYLEFELARHLGALLPYTCGALHHLTILAIQTSCSKRSIGSFGGVFQDVGCC